MATEQHEFSVSVQLPAHVVENLQAQYVESSFNNFEQWLGLQLEMLARIRYAEPEPQQQQYPEWLLEGTTR
jgi:hypothetical protein